MGGGLVGKLETERRAGFSIVAWKNGGLEMSRDLWRRGPRSGEAALGDLESPEPDLIHPRREAVGV